MAIGDSLIASMRLMPYTAITADSEAPSLPAADLKTEQPGERWRATDLDSADVYIDLSAVPATTGVTAYQFIGLIAHSGSIDGLWTMMTGPTKSASSGIHTATTVYPDNPLWMTPDQADLGYRHAWIVLPNPIEIASEPWLHIQINDPDNPAGFFDLGCVLVDLPFVPTLPLSPRPRAGFTQQPQIQESLLGASYARETPIRDRREFEFQAFGSEIAILEAEARDLQRRVGLCKAVFAIQDSSPAARAMDRCIYGRFESLPPIDQVETWSRLTVPFAVNEMLPGWEPQE